MKYQKWIIQLSFLLLTFNALSQAPSPFLSEPAYTNLEVAIKNKNKVISLALHYRGEETSEQLHQISQLTNLKYLSITGTYLPHLPAAIFQLKNLQALKLSCSLTEIPPQLILLEKLEYLDLTFNSIIDIPNWIDKIPGLKTLILNTNPIKTISNNIANCKKLSCLHISRIYGLKTIPEAIGNISGLEELYIHDNSLYSIPQSIKGLKSLRVLDASANQLQDLPTEIVNLKRLEVLNLSGNKLSKLPAHFDRLHSLRNLDLAFNPVEDAPNQKLPVSLQQIKFINSKLTAFPDALKHCTKLESLEITKSAISTIPGWVSLLKKLKTLALVNNKITTLPSLIQNNRELNRINLSNNLIDSIPPDIFSLPRLQYLILTGNKVTSVPKEIVHAGSLEYLAVKESSIRDSTSYQQLKKSLKGRIVFEREDMAKSSTMGDCPCYSEKQLPKYYHNTPSSVFTKTEVSAGFGNYGKGHDDFFSNNVKFPDIQLDPFSNNTVSDTVLIKFVVNPSPRQLTYVSALSFKWVETKNEAIRLLRLSCPYWHPAITGGREVKAWAQVMFIFNQHYEKGTLKKELTVYTSQTPNTTLIAR